MGRQPKYGATHAGLDVCHLNHAKVSANHLWGSQFTHELGGSKFKKNQGGARIQLQTSRKTFSPTQIHYRSVPRPVKFSSPAYSGPEIFQANFCVQILVFQRTFAFKFKRPSAHRFWTLLTSSELLRTAARPTSPVTIIKPHPTPPTPHPSPWQAQSSSPDPEP